MAGRSRTVSGNGSLHGGQNSSTAAGAGRQQQRSTLLDHPAYQPPSNVSAATAAAAAEYNATLVEPPTAEYEDLRSPQDSVRQGLESADFDAREYFSWWTEVSSFPYNGLAS